jgi:hypothetical protein
VLSLCDTALYSTVFIDRVMAYIHSMHFLLSLDPNAARRLTVTCECDS